MAGTTAPAAKRALRALLAARPGLAGITVHYAHPGDTAAEELVWLGRGWDGEHAPATMRAGTKRRNETYTLLVGIETRRPGRTTEAAEQRCAELAAEVEDALAANSTLDGLLSWAVVSNYRGLAGPTDLGEAAAVEVSVTCHARLL